MDPSVAGLVYIAAHMPDAGENEADDGKRFPSDLSKSGAIKKTADGFTYLDPAQFHEYFAADLSAEQAAVMARSRMLNLADHFKAVITTACPRPRALVCHTSQQPQGRSLRRQSRGLCIQAMPTVRHLCGRLDVRVFF